MLLTGHVVAMFARDVARPYPLAVDESGEQEQCPHAALLSRREYAREAAVGSGATGERRCAARHTGKDCAGRKRPRVRPATVIWRGWCVILTILCRWTQETPRRKDDEVSPNQSTDDSLLIREGDVPSPTLPSPLA
jgi:hypothetical protein